MSASEITEPLRFNLTLDPGLLLEGLILRRLSGLKRRRGQNWLRALLVQGLLVEGQWLRRECLRNGGCASPQQPRIPTSLFASWLERTQASAQQAIAPAASIPTPVSLGTTATRLATKTKPFAHLGKVIG